MLTLKPNKILVFLPIIGCALGWIAIMQTSFSFSLEVIFILCLFGIMIYEILKLLQKWPYALIALSIPSQAYPWQIKLRNGKIFDAKLLNSTRLTHTVIILHFRVLHSKMRIYQIVLPKMIGKENFHDLLVHLKTT